MLCTGEGRTHLWVPSIAWRSASRRVHDMRQAVSDRATERKLSANHRCIGGCVCPEPHGCPLFRRTAETENAFSLEQAMAREAHRQMYTDLLRSGHRHRKRLAQPLPAPDDPVSLGLQQAAGLKEPKIRLPSANEPLWLQEKIVVRPKHRCVGVAATG